MNVRVNDDQGSGWQRLPAIAMMPENGCMIVWEDYHLEGCNLYYQYLHEIKDLSRCFQPSQ